MEKHLMVGRGYKFLKTLLIVLVVFSIVFIWLFIKSRRPPDFKTHRSQLEMLEEVYKLRRQELGRYYNRKIDAAPDEVLSVEYQQELNQKLEDVQNIYFDDRQAILKGAYGVLTEHWLEEIEKLNQIAELSLTPAS